MGRIIVVGLNHKTAPVHVRERVAFSPGHIADALQVLQSHVPKGIILSTCNRTEIYAISNGQPAYRGACDFLSAESGVSVEELSPYLYVLEDEEAVEHLFRVAAGLESMIVGEYEVLGQVRQALEEAESGGIAACPLRELFQMAVGVGRRVREETDISRNAASVSSAAAGLAKKIFSDLESCNVLVIGAGEAGALVAKALVKIGACRVTVVNRSHSRAAALAEEIGGTAIPFHQLKEELCSCDILISCSGAPHYIVDPEVVEEAVQGRDSRPLLLIDIAVPRDIDPEVRQVEGVVLHDIDDLSSVVQTNRGLREMEADKATAIVEAEVGKFVELCNSRDKAPVIKALVKKAEQIRSAQLTKAIEEIPDLSEEDRLRLEAMTRAIIKKVLHSPITCVKNNNGNHVQAIRELFDLQEVL
jgi:glutamyl-tRNA reductase